MKTIADIKAIRGTMQKNIEDSTKIRVVVGMARNLDIHPRAPLLISHHSLRGAVAEREQFIMGISAFR